MLYDDKYLYKSYFVLVIIIITVIMIIILLYAPIIVYQPSHRKTNITETI